MWNKIVIFVFVAQKVFSWVCKITVDVTWIMLPISLLRFWAWERFSCIAVYGGSESSQIQTKIS